MLRLTSFSCCSLSHSTTAYNSSRTLHRIYLCTQLQQELLLNPIVIHRSEHECVMIEAVNSIRSHQGETDHEMDAILASKFSRFLMQRADNFIILRRKPMPVRRPVDSATALFLPLRAFSSTLRTRDI